MNRYWLVSDISLGEIRMITGYVEILNFTVGALGQEGGEGTLLRIFLRLVNALGQWTHLRNHLL